MTAAIVIVLGTIGAVARFVVSAAVQRRADPDLPLGTAAVNLTGALLLGLVVGLGIDGNAVVASGGLLAGFTTYSTWMVEAVAVMGEGRTGWKRAAFDLFGLMAAGMAVAGFGLVLGRWIG